MSSNNNNNNNNSSMERGMRWSSGAVFTVSQWQELEQQALILKYLLAGMSIPPDLLIPIHKTFHSLSPNFFPNTPLGYCSFYGKKVDPEPGRCRRTDGKKWRCSKDAYGDSKYCERHMHRGRNRSRKPVEPLQTTASSQSSLSSAVSPVTVKGDNNSSSISSGGAGTAAGCYQNLPTNTFGSGQGLGTGTNQSQIHLENIPYGIPYKDYRYQYGQKADVDEHSFFSKASGKSLQIDSSLDTTCPLTSSQVSIFPTSKSSDYSMLQNDYPQHSLFENEFGTEPDTANQSRNLIRPFFEELPKSKSAWRDLENEISKLSSFSSTQLSIMFPMGSSDLSTTCSRSPTW